MTTTRAVALHVFDRMHRFHTAAAAGRGQLAVVESGAR